MVLYCICVSYSLVLSTTTYNCSTTPENSVVKTVANIQSSMKTLTHVVKVPFYSEAVHPIRPYLQFIGEFIINSENPIRFYSDIDIQWYNALKSKLPYSIPSLSPLKSSHQRNKPPPFPPKILFAMLHAIYNHVTTISSVFFHK